MKYIRENQANTSLNQEELQILDNLISCMVKPITFKEPVVNWFDDTEEAVSIEEAKPSVNNNKRLLLKPLSDSRKFKKNKSIPDKEKIKDKWFGLLMQVKPLQVAPNKAVTNIALNPKIAKEYLSNWRTERQAIVELLRYHRRRYQTIKRALFTVDMAAIFYGNQYIGDLGEHFKDCASYLFIAAVFKELDIASLCKNRKRFIAQVSRFPTFVEKYCVKNDHASKDESYTDQDIVRLLLIDAYAKNGHKRQPAYVKTRAFIQKMAKQAKGDLQNLKKTITKFHEMMEQIYETQLEQETSEVVIEPQDFVTRG